MKQTQTPRPRRSIFVYIIGGLILLCACVAASSIFTNRANDGQVILTAEAPTIAPAATSLPPSPTVAAVGTPIDQLTRAAFGDAWPFTVESGLAACTEGRITFMTGGKTYALNEAAIAAMRDGSMQHFQDVTAIMADASANLAPILDAAQKLCA